MSYWPSVSHVEMVQIIGHDKQALKNVNPDTKRQASTSFLVFSVVSTSDP
jgi:hypothetical protein